METPNKLFILPFDHQTGLWKIFGWMEPLTQDQEQLMRTTRMITYQGYLYGISLGIPPQDTAILTDDIYGSEVLAQAKKDGVPTISTLEKSGQQCLIFQHENWQERLLEQRPDWIKTLVRFNPTADTTFLASSLENLKKVSDFAREHGFRYMIEPLVQPTEAQREIADFDHTMRPTLTCEMIRMIYEYGIFPTVWKIEGLDDPHFYEQVADVLNHYDPTTRIVVLGRNETLETVTTWVRASQITPLSIGFAVGRTIFLDALKKFIAGDMTNSEAIHEIGERYYQLYADTFKNTN